MICAIGKEKVWMFRLEWSLFRLAVRGARTSQPFAHDSALDFPPGECPGETIEQPKRRQMNVLKNSDIVHP